ncbi:MAG TPA: type IV pilin protein [Gammaproteobacteria bacterium]|nr:type IV pilin protein [Gammaproteobacteria bacterium]
MRQTQRGFTLIELMITVAIVGIIAAIAYPSYIDSVRAGRRSEAMSALLKIQLDQEKYRANNTSYGSLAACSPAAAGCWVISSTAGTGLTTDGGYYDLSITSPNTSSFTASATAVTAKGQQNDKANGVTCSPLKVNQDGPILSDGGVDKSACWKKN